MTEHETEILSHILDGGAIVSPNSDEPLIFTTLVSEDSDNFELGLNELSNCSVHYTKDQLTIIKLKEQLADMTDQLKTIKTQKSKLGSDLREVNGSGPKPTIRSPYRQHLTIREVKEIEEIFKRDFSTPAKILITAYGISQPVASKLRRGSHGLSTETYKTHLRNIGQLKD